MTRAVISYGPTDSSKRGPVVDMSTSLGALDLPAPVLTASGCAAADGAADARLDISFPHPR